MFTLNCRGKLLLLETPLVMGILNITDNSFYKGHLQEDLLAITGKMLAEGAAIIDIGGQTTKPGSERLSASIETERILPVIQSILEKYPDCIISVDTYQSAVANAAVQAGARIVNDISGGEMDPLMIPTVASLQVPYICMHMQGRPESMQDHPHYENVVKEVMDYFVKKIAACQSAGIKDLIIDPGFGFGKTIDHNFQLLQQLSAFQLLGKPILAGLSRKASIYKTLATTPDDALNGTTVLNTIALLQGASILRVHDVKEAREAVQLIQAYKKAPSVN
ncbi:MAG: dihydropteroate synthase [Chitinophagaceae bacterium]